MQFSDDSAFRESTSGMDRPKGNSSSTVGGQSTSSQFSSSIEGKPSMDSVLRPQIKKGTRSCSTSPPVGIPSDEKGMAAMECRS